MPRTPSGGGGTRRKRKAPSKQHLARVQARQYPSQARQISTGARRQRQASRVARGPSRRPVAFRTLPKRPEPFRVQRQRTRREAERADKRIGASPKVPHIPLLPVYSPRQQQVIRRTYKQAAKRAGTNPQGLYLLGSTAQRQQMTKVTRRLHESDALLVQARYKRLPKWYRNAMTPFVTFAGQGEQRAPNREYHSPEPGESLFKTAAIGLTKVLGNPIASVSAGASQRARGDFALPEAPKAIQAGALTAINVVRATAEDKGAVFKSSVRTAKESIAGIPQGLKMLADDPVGALEAMGADYERRYGSVLKDPAKFREMVKDEYGLTPYVLDLTAGAGGGGAAAGALARTSGFGRLAELPGVTGRAARVLHEASQAEKARPRLRFGGGRAGTREQPVSRNLFAALGQRHVVDPARSRAYRKRAEKAGWKVRDDGSLQAIPGRRQERFGALRPGPGEVVSRFNLRNTVPGLRQAPGGVRRDIGSRQSTARLKLLNLAAMRERQIKKLTKPLTDAERDVGLPLMLRHGIKAGASGVAALKRRRAKIVREREAQGFEVPDVLRETNDELAVIDRVLEDPERYLTPRTREVANQLRDMQIEDAQRVLPEQQEVLRRLKPRAELLDVPPNLRNGERAPDVAEMERLAGMLEDTAAQQRKTGLYGFAKGKAKVSFQRSATQLREKINRIIRGEDVDVDGPDLDEEIKDAGDFIKRVREASEAADLEEPAYWMSGTLDEAERIGRRQYTTGAGLRATELPSHRFTGATHRLGAERQSFDVFEAGEMRNLKRRVQHEMVARNAETYAYEWSLNGGKGRTLAELDKLAQDNAIDPRSLTFLNPRILRKRGDEDDVARGMVARQDEAAQLAEDAMSDIHGEVRKRLTWDELMAEDRQAVSPGRYLAYPSEIGDLLEAATRPSGTFQRTLELLLKTKPSRVMLGLNPPWLGIQIASNGLLAGIAGMSPTDIYGMLKFDRYLKRTDPEAHAALEAELGISKGRHWQTDIGRVMKPGSRLAATSRAFSHTKVGRLAHAGNAPSRIMDAMFGTDAAQTAFFRKAVWYSEAKKAARLEMGKGIRGAALAQGRLERVLRLPPDEQVRAVAENAELFERHAKHVDKWLGNYTKYSSFERKSIASNVLFYGWLRHSLRLTFYTIPIQHPIMADILGNIGRLGAQEIKDLFGVPSSYDLPMHALANVYSGYDTTAEGRKMAKKGTLQAANWSRMSPFLNAVTQMERPSQVAGFVSPLYQELADQLFEESSFTGRDWRIRGEYPPSENQRPSNYYDLESRARLGLRDTLSLAFPYRAAERAMLAPSQTDDALLWSPRPLNLKSEESQAGIRRSRREWRRLGTDSAILDQLLPTRARITPLPAMVKREREKEAAVRARRNGGRRQKKRYSGGSSSRYGGSSSRYGG